MITSSANPTIKQIRQLRDRKARQSSGLFFAEGLRIVGELLARRWPVERLVIAPELLISEYGLKLVDDYTLAGGQVVPVSASVFDGLSGKEGPQGIAAVARQQWTTMEDIVLGRGEYWTALDSVADPGNLGTILRTSDGAGGGGVILLDHSTDPYDPSSVRASMGALFTQRLARCSFDAFVEWKKAVGISVVGSSDKASQDYREYQYPNPVVLLMGSERHGLQPQHFQACDEVVSIPMAGSSDSLNLSVATGIILYEIFHQNRAGKQ